MASYKKRHEITFSTAKRTKSLELIANGETKEMLKRKEKTEKFFNKVKEKIASDYNNGCDVSVVRCFRNIDTQHMEKIIEKQVGGNDIVQGVGLDKGKCIVYFRKTYGKFGVR